MIFHPAPGRRKAPRDQAPSNQAIVGRYVLPARIFDLLADTQPGAVGEIQLTDAIAELMGHEGADAYRLLARSYDCGSKIGYLEATLAYALQHPQLADDRVAGSVRPYSVETDG